MKIDFAHPIDTFCTSTPHPEFAIHRGDDSWVTGRAGMKYRDLIPGRLGGFIIASRIHVTEAGPVPDYVHFHNIHFQLIYCVNGWARLVYEDQGEPFRFESGDCVLQPPGIRHRVLETSGNFDVIEFSSPAEHETHVDHELRLPNDSINEERLFGEQQFVLSRLAEAKWETDKRGELKTRLTEIGKASGGLIDVRVLHGVSVNGGFSEEFDSGLGIKHLIKGNTTLSVEGRKAIELKKGDTVVQPAGTIYRFSESSADLEILELSIY